MVPQCHVATVPQCHVASISEEKRGLENTQIPMVGKAISSEDFFFRRESHLLGEYGFLALTMRLLRNPASVGRCALTTGFMSGVSVMGVSDSGAGGTTWADSSCVPPNVNTSTSDVEGKGSK